VKVTDRMVSAFQECKAATWRDKIAAAIAAAPTPVMPELPEAFAGWTFNDASKTTLYTLAQLHACAAQYAAAQNAELIAQRDDAEGRFRAAWDSHVAKNMECERLSAERDQLRAEKEALRLRVEGLEMACNIASGLKDIRHD